MNYIYCITNKINSKRYVGKTTKTIEERFVEHCQDSTKERCNKRPLYDAMNKYGIENFIIEELEKVEDVNILDEREIHWIKELQTYGSKGYNATKGGDGKILYDHKEIIELYNLGYSCKQVSEKVGCDHSTVITILKANGIQPRKQSHKVSQYSLDGKLLNTFDSVKEAVKWLHTNGVTQNKKASNPINECCNGKRDKIYGYRWKYIILET